MPFAAVNGVTLYYERHGDIGDPLVFVHGYTGDITDWRLQIAEFSRDFRILVMDLRGHGRSEAPSDGACYTVAAHDRGRAGDSSSTSASTATTSSATRWAAPSRRSWPFIRRRSCYR